MCLYRPSTESEVLTRYAETAAIRRACGSVHGRCTFTGVLAGDRTWHIVNQVTTSDLDHARFVAKLEHRFNPVTIFAVYN